MKQARMDKKEPLIRRIIKSRAFNIVIISVVMCVPLLYAGLLTWTYEKPMENLDRVAAAVVNLDQGAHQDGPSGDKPRDINLGKEITERLTKGSEDAGFDWQVASKAEAQRGLDNGKYLAMLVIPQDLSAQVSRLDSADATAASAVKLQLSTNDGVNYLAGTMARAVASEMQGRVRESANQEITTALVDSIGEIGGQLGQAAAGAQQLASGNGQLSSGATQLASGAADLRSGVEQLASGAGQVGQGAQSLSGGAGQLATGLQQLRDKTANLPAQTEALSQGAGQVLDGAKSLESGAQNLASGAGQLAQQVNQTVTALRKIAGGLGTAGTTAAGTGTAGSGAGLAGGNAATTATTTTAAAAQAVQAQAALQALAQMMNQQVADPADPSGATKTDPLTALQHGVGALQQGSSALATGAGQLATGAGSLAGGTQQLAQAAPALSQGISQAAAGAEKLASGASELAGGSGRLVSGSVQLTDGSGRLLSGAQALAAGADKAASGAAELAGKLRQGADKLPSYDSAQTEKISATAAAPISITVVRAHGVENNGAGFAPFFLSLALWIGGIAAYFIFPALDRRRPGDSWWHCAARSFGVAAAVGIGQAILVALVVGPLIGATGGKMVALAGMMALASLAFVALNQALLALLGFRGRFFSVLLLVLQIAAMGATFPIATAPKFMQVISPWLPMTHTAAAFRTIIAGQGLSIWPAIAILLITLALAVSVTLSSAWATRGEGVPNDDPTVNYRDTAANQGRLARWLPASVLN